MILSYATSLVAIAATAICFIIITLMYWRSPSGPLTFKRRVIIADYCLLCYIYAAISLEAETMKRRYYAFHQSFPCIFFGNPSSLLVRHSVMVRFYAKQSMPYYSITFCPCLFWLLRWYMRQMVISIISRTMTKWCRLLTKQYRWRHICELLLWLVSYSVCY